jgi:hypothetical protein
MSMFKLNKCFWTEVLIFRFENNNLKFKYQILDQFFLEFKLKIPDLECQFSDSNNNIQHWNVHFSIHFIIFKLEVLILRIENNNLELKFQDQIKWLFKFKWNFFRVKV